MPSVTLFKWFYLLTELKEETRKREKVWMENEQLCLEGERRDGPSSGPSCPPIPQSPKLQTLSFPPLFIYPPWTLSSFRTAGPPGPQRKLAFWGPIPLLSSFPPVVDRVLPLTPSGPLPFSVHLPSWPTSFLVSLSLTLSLEGV